MRRPRSRTSCACRSPAAVSDRRHAQARHRRVGPRRRIDRGRARLAGRAPRSADGYFQSRRRHGSAHQPRRIPRARRRLHRLPHPARRQAVRRRPRDADAVREPLRFQHHAGRRDRHRAMDGRRLLSNDAKGHLARRLAALSRDAFRVLHESHARRLRRDLRVPHVGCRPCGRRTVRTSCASPSTSATSSSAGARFISRKASTSPIRSSRRNGTAARTWSKASAIARCATPPSTGSAARARRTLSKAG